MEAEAKAKVVASVWGATFIQFLAALAVLPRLIWKKRMNHAILSISHPSSMGSDQNIFDIRYVLNPTPPAGILRI